MSCECHVLQGVLSASANPGLMLQPLLSNELPCELLSLETMHRWILCKPHPLVTCDCSTSVPSPTAVGFLLCSSQLTSYPGASDLWKLALYDGFYLSLCRDEAIAVHAIFEKLLSDSKDKK